MRRVWAGLVSTPPLQTSILYKSARVEPPNFPAPAMRRAWVSTGLRCGRSKCGRSEGHAFRHKVHILRQALRYVCIYVVCCFVLWHICCAHIHSAPVTVEAWAGPRIYIYIYIYIYVSIIINTYIYIYIILNGKCIDISLSLYIYICIYAHLIVIVTVTVIIIRKVNVTVIVIVMGRTIVT